MVAGQVHAAGTTYINAEESRVDPSDVVWGLVASSSSIGLIGLDPDADAMLEGLKRCDGVTSVPLVEVVCGTPMVGTVGVVEWPGPQPAVPEVRKAMPLDIERE
jgi:hypothetical protein